MNLPKLDITMVVPGLPFDGETLKKQSLGGSETAAVCLARELHKIGHRVTIFSNCDKPSITDGVRYLPLAGFDAYVRFNPCDVTIVQRTPEVFVHPTNSRLNVLWCHDLALGRQADVMRGVLWNVDRVALLSDFMVQQYKDVYRLPDSVIFKTRNGIDLDLFSRLGKIKREKKTLIYASRPERGVDNLLGPIFEEILKRDPDVVLKLAGYNNQAEHLKPFYDQVNALIKKHGNSVKWLGHLTKKELYNEYAKATVYAYPTPSKIAPEFAEVSCITAMECMAAGLPIVASDRGALRETIARNAGHLVQGNPWSPEYVKDFADAVMGYIANPVCVSSDGAAGKEHAQSLGWDDVAAEWSEMFYATIAQANDNPHRLAHHLIKQSDIMAAKHLVDGLLKDDPSDEHAKELHEVLERDFGFAWAEDGFRIQYEKIGQTHTDVFEHVPNEPRFGVVQAWLEKHHEVQSILDYGCAHGGYCVNLYNRVGRYWTGVDIDKHSIAWAIRNYEERGNPETKVSQMEFVVGDYTNLHEVILAKHDAAFIFEVLEHVREPWAVVDAVEQHVKPGGKVLITVPFGPWEHDSYKTYPHRCHIWEFDQHDLREMLRDKKNVAVTVQPHGYSQRLNRPIGWYWIEYEVSEKKMGGTVVRPASHAINLDRKLALQRPGQTVSATLMAGPNAEDQLNWCLRSLEDVADEIVIADTGMNEEALAIAKKHGARIVPSVDPKVHGFEAPRNDALAHARMDFVLWIDTDEKLLGSRSIHKYLRGNAFNGYSIRQHHFAIDTAFKPDLPVRLIRRVAEDGRRPRFFGMIHEHPELALNEGPGVTAVLSDVHIAHTGYLTEDIRRGRFSRNYPLLMADTAKYPDRKLQKHFLMRDSMLMTMYELQQNGGVVTNEMAARCHEVIRLYREYFLGQSSYVNVDSLQYYSQACTVLGLGAEVVLAIGAGKEAAKPGEPLVARFATEEDYLAEINWRIKDSVKPFFMRNY